MDFGIISLGNHAVNRIIPAIKASGSNITAIYTRDRLKGEKVSKEFGAEYIPDLEKFMKNKFEATYISSPNSLHFVHSKMSLDSGKSVLVEKPFTINVEEAQILSDLSKRRDLKLSIGFHLRFHPAVQEIKRCLSTKVIGEAKVASGKWTSFTPRSGDISWRSLPEMAGGGSVVGTGVHVMDSFVNFFGRDAESVYATNFPKCNTVENTMHTTIKFAGGVISDSLSSRVISSESNDLNIYGENGSLTVTNFYDTKVSSKLYINEVLKMEYPEKTDMYLEEVKAFIGNDSRIASSADGVLSTRLLLLSQKSACEDRAFSL